MRTIALCVLLATGCGSYDPDMFEEKDKKNDGESEENGGESKDPVKEELDKESDNGPVAMAYSNNVLLAGVSEIFSATKIIDTIYFTGKDSQDNHVLGKMKPDETVPTLLPVARMNANNISLSGKYILPTNADENLFLMGDYDIIEVDLTTLKAVGKVASECAITSPLTFSKDNRWNTIWNNTLSVCGMVDGATIESGDAILDGYTGERLTLDNYSRFSFDGVKLFQYQPEFKLLTVYGADFTREVTYSTGNYLYNGTQASFVSDNNGGKWMLGCANGECYRTEATLTPQ